MVSEEIFKELLKNSIWLPWQADFFDRIKSCGQFLEGTSQGTFLPNLVQIGPAVWEEMLFNSLTNDKILDRSKLQAFADD